MNAYMELITPSSAGTRRAAAGAGMSPAHEGAGDTEFLSLVASLPTTIYSVFGVADMHLSYVVFRMVFAGREFAHFIAEAVLLLGAGCAPANLDTPGACLQGRVVVSMDPTDAGENMLAGALTGSSGDGGSGDGGGEGCSGGLRLSEVLEFVGLQATAWSHTRMHHVVSSACFPLGATVSYGVREHAFFVPSEGGGHAEAALYRVSAGFSGQGAMHVLGAAAAGPGRWTADLGLGRVLVNVPLPRVHVDGLVLAGAGGEGGPLLKVVASVLGGGGPGLGRVVAYIQGEIRLGAFESAIVLEVSDQGVRGAAAGRYGRGLHVSVAVSAGYVQTHLLSATRYHIAGRVSRLDVAEMSRHIPGAVGVLCHRDSKYCTGSRRAGLSMANWFKICSITFTQTAAAGTPATPNRAHVTVRAWVHGHMQVLRDVCRETSVS